MESFLSSAESEGDLARAKSKHIAHGLGIKCARAHRATLYTEHSKEAAYRPRWAVGRGHTGSAQSAGTLHTSMGRITDGAHGATAVVSAA